MFLMPSRYEPCGLNQIYSLRYGTVPVAHATGGLEDTISAETGFKFHEYSVTALIDVVREAIGVYRHDPGRWLRMVRRGMEQDYSWDYSAREYSKLYDALAARTPLNGVLRS
jgi:starch synthase